MKKKDRVQQKSKRIIPQRKAIALDISTALKEPPLPIEALKRLQLEDERKRDYSLLGRRR